MGAAAIRISANKSGSKVQETASSVLHVVEGQGSTIVAGEQLSWKTGDTFCIPAWHEYQHHAGEETVYLYKVHDEPMLRSLGFYRTSGQDVESLVSE